MTAVGAATSASVDLRGISAANQTAIFGPNLKVTATLKAEFTGKTSGGPVKSVTEIKESKTFNAFDANTTLK